MTGLLVVLGLISQPSRAAAADVPVGPGSAATFPPLDGNVATHARPNIVPVNPGNAIPGFPPGISNGAAHAGGPQADPAITHENAAAHAPATTTTRHHCGGCHHPTSTTTTDTTTTTRHPCGCHPTSTTSETTTTTTDDTDTTTSTIATTTDSIAPGTGTSHHSGGMPGAQGNNYPSSPDKLAYTGSSSALIPLVFIGSLLLILGGLLFLVVRTRTHGRRPPTA